MRSSGQAHPNWWWVNSVCLAELLREDRSDTETFMDAQESLAVVNPLLLPLDSESDKGDPTRGPKSRRKLKPQTDDGSGGLEKFQQISAGIKLSKEITDDIIWDGLAPEDYPFSIVLASAKSKNCS